MPRNPSLNLSLSAFGDKYALTVESTAIHIEIETLNTIVVNDYISFIL